jgi:8-oxo-dGTP pyrophosphatase MutT (NUDIX family)
MDGDFPAKASRILSSRLPHRLKKQNCGRAAVLMPAYPGTQGPQFLLTRRTDKVETHKGQISFPGGVVEPADSSLAQTALRETWEEIGLAPEHVQLLGEFDEYLSVTGLIVTPYLGWLDRPFVLAPNVEEVAEVLHVPLQVFRDRSGFRIEIRRREGQDYPVYFYEYQGQEIWGLTARIIHDLLELLDASGLF